MISFSYLRAAFFVAAVTIFCGCGESTTDNPITDNPETDTPYANVWGDEGLRKIYTAQDQRNSEELFPYLRHEKAEYRAAAAMAFASHKDTIFIDNIGALLSDTESKVQKAAAYTLGQLKNIKGAGPLVDLILGGKASSDVNAVAWEALGKCGEAEELAFLIQQSQTASDPTVQSGIAWGLYRFALHGVTSEEGTDLAMRYLEPMNTPDVMFPASQYLARAGNIDLSSHANKLREAFDRIQDPDIQMALARSMGKVKKATVTRKFMTDVFGGDYDYRVIVNAVYACRSFDMHWVPLEVIKLLDHENDQVVIAASEFLASKGGLAPELFYAKSKKVENWRARANLLKAALKDGYSGRALENVRDMYMTSQNVYQKGALLIAIAGHANEMKFVGHEMLSTESVVLRSYGMEALATMRQSRGYKKAQEKYESSGAGMDYDHGFNIILKEALERGDVAVLAQAAILLTNPELESLTEHWKTQIDFLKECRDKLKLPQEIETYQEMEKAIAYLSGGDQPAPVEKSTDHPIDWDLVATISSDQVVEIETSLGIIKVQLFVDEAPGSVSNFVALIKEGFYDDKAIHRVVPNFVMQDGCPRGDGYGGPAYSIRSEFGPLKYGTGVLGMASAGPDTESSQWFITHSPTPHLDGGYSIFGRVIEGMDVVHLLGVGDKILLMKISG